MRIFILSLFATFLGGLATGLLVSYPIAANTIVVPFWALFIMLAACTLGCWAIVDWTHMRGRVKSVNQLVEVMMHEMAEEERQKKLRIVDRE